MGLKEPGLRGSLRNVSVGIAAIPVSDIAQFEDGLLHPSFELDTTAFDVDSDAPVLSDTFSLKTATASDQRIHSVSGLDRYPQQDQRFACYFQFDSDGGPTIGWGSDGASDSFYEAVGFGATDEIFIRRIDNGTATELGTRASVALSNNTWYDMEIEWLSNGDITIRVFDVDQSTGDRQGSALATTTATDTTYVGDGVAFRDVRNVTAPCRWDNYRILEAL